MMFRGGATVSNTLAHQVVSRDLMSCTSCGSWLDDTQPHGVSSLLCARSWASGRSNNPAGYLTVCHGCQDMLNGAFRYNSDDPHNPCIRRVFTDAGFILEPSQYPEEVPVWIELTGGPIWYQLTTDGRRVVTAREDSK